MLTSLKRTTILALQNLWRNKLLTIATILIMTLILFIFNIVLTVNLLAQNTLESLQKKVDLILYLEENADPLTVNQLITELKAFPETQNVTYTSKEDALNNLLKQYSDDLGVFADPELENPLPASIQIITKEPENHAAILSYVEKGQYKGLIMELENNQENQQIAQNLTHITDFSKKLLWAIMVTFIVGSLLIIANAIHVTIFSRKQEIHIMEIVGATPQFIRAPFIMEGALYGFVSVLLAMGLLTLFLEKIDIAELGFIELNLPLTRLLIIQAIGGIVIGTLSSHLALKYYLGSLRTL